MRMTLRILLAGALATGLLSACGNDRPSETIDSPSARATLTPRTSDGSEPSVDALNAALGILQERVSALNVPGATAVLDSTNFVITIPGDDGTQARGVGQTARLYFRPVIDGVISQLPQNPVLPEQNPATTTLSPTAIADAKATRQSTDPAVQQQALAALDCSAPDPLSGNDDPKLPLVTCSADGEKFRLAPSIIDGQEIADATTSFNAQAEQHVVTLTFRSAGSETWSRYTAQNVGSRIAITLDSRVISAPVIRGAMPAGSRTEISGNFTADDAKALAVNLKYGSLPFALDVSEVVVNGK